MSIIKVCNHCGEYFHGGDGFVKIDDLIYCCTPHAQIEGHQNPQWSELDDFDEADKVEYSDVDFCIYLAETLYLEVKNNISNGPAKRTLDRLKGCE